MNVMCVGKQCMEDSGWHDLPWHLLIVLLNEADDPIGQSPI